MMIWEATFYKESNAAEESILVLGRVYWIPNFESLVINVIIIVTAKPQPQPQPQPQQNKKLGETR